MKKSIVGILFCCFVLVSNIYSQDLTLNLKKAEYLYSFAFDCIDKEYPNKPGEVLGSDSYLAPPRIMHPAFYGCFDWHSSVHGHWALVTILSRFPDFGKKNEIMGKLSKNITKENVAKEVAFLKDELNKDFERTYGWAWLLKLDEAFREWNTPEASLLHENLQPLVELVSEKFIDFLGKLKYPIRVGEHTNTAFSLSFAYDFAKKYDPVLAKKIEEKARQYYLSDRGCPLSWEPSGFDFLSPCLHETSLMAKILPKKDFIKWLDKFLPGFRKNPGKYLIPAEVTDRSDGKLAHLDGLNFSRSWCLSEIGHLLGNDEMLRLAAQHFNYSYSKMDTGEYAGAHWLASFALYALIKAGV
jgi:hypothetical protein